MVVPASNSAQPAKAFIVWGCFSCIIVTGVRDPRSNVSPKRSVPLKEQQSLRLTHEHKEPNSHLKALARNICRLEWALAPVPTSLEHLTNTNQWALSPILCVPDCYGCNRSPSEWIRQRQHYGRARPRLAKTDRDDFFGRLPETSTRGDRSSLDISLIFGKRIA